MIFRLMIGLLVFGGILIFWGFQEMRVGGEAKSKPQEISVEKLVKDGYGDNAYVTVTDYVVSDYGVVESKDETPNLFTKIWMVVYPDNREDSDNLPVLIVRSSKIRTESQWDQFAATTKCTGLIVNSIESLGSDEKKKLKQGLPSGVDVDKAFILDHNRKPAGSKGMLMMAGGGVLILAPVGVLYMRGSQGVK